jgi:hypothetical protein
MTTQTITTGTIPPGDLPDDDTDYWVEIEARNLVDRLKQPAK